MYVATAYTAVALGDRAEAAGRLLEALEADANLVQAHSLYGQVLAMGGHCDGKLLQRGGRMGRKASDRSLGPPTQKSPSAS